LLALAAAVAASLATWKVDDPSLSHATDHAARNVLAVPGAILADLFMQFLGLSAIVFLVPPVLWAWRLVFGKPALFNWRVALTWIGGSLFSAADLRGLPGMGKWARPTGYGGVAGAHL